MTPFDYAMIVVDAALWAAIIWHRSQATVVGALWWSCVSLALIITLKIGVIAHPLNQITGGVYLDELVIHLTGVVLFHLTLSWATLVRTGTQAYRPLRRTATVTMLAFLVITWFLSPVYGIPASAGWLPPDVLAAPVMAVHWLGLHVYLLATSVVFGTIAWSEQQGLTAGPVRLSIRLLLTASALFAVINLAESAAQVFVLVGTPEPAWLMLVVNIVLIVVFAAFLTAVAIPLARRRRTRATSQSHRHYLESLWTYTQAARESGPDAQPLSLLEDRARAMSLHDLVIDIRDQMYDIEKHVEPRELAAAGRSVRAHGSQIGVAYKARVAAACLILGAERYARKHDEVPPPPASLTGLGRGRTVLQEADWLSAVGRALTALLEQRARPLGDPL